MIFQLFTLFFIIEPILSADISSSNDILTNGDFTTDLFSNIVKKNGEKNQENLIFSPASIHTCLALAYIGAEGITANEMINGLHFNTGNKKEIVNQFENMLQVARGSNSLLKLVNKIYANKNLKIKPGFNEFAKKSFESDAESLDFTDNENAVNIINNWVTENTNNKIKNLVNTDIIKSDTKLILINAIYFKGNWKYPLKVRNAEFLNNGINRKETEMMLIKDEFFYSNLFDLNAKAIKLPYANSDLNLMLILPNEKTGLSALEDKLKYINLIDLNNKFILANVDIIMPKFKIESQIDLKNILQNMGMKTMFTDDAHFNFFTSSSESSKIGNILHKAFIDVNELGTEAGAATATTLDFKSAYEYFTVDHPFFFAILDKSNVYFSGHLINV